MDDISEWLPTAFTEAEKRRILAACSDALGGRLCLYRRVNSAENWDARIDWMDVEEEKATWASRCRCTACGETWYSGWKDGALVLIRGEDGTTYPGIPNTDNEDTYIYSERETLLCPFCGREIVATRPKSMGRGKTWGIMAGEPICVEGSTVLLYTLATRLVTGDGRVREWAEPCCAVELTERGCLRRYIRYTTDMAGRIRPQGAWRRASRWRFPSLTRYESAAGILNTVVGTVLTDHEQRDFRGQSAEKTGLSAYLAAGGELPDIYLKFWQRHKNVENLVKDGWAGVIGKLLAKCYDTAIDYGNTTIEFDNLLRFADWSETRPKDMLRMSKEGYKLAKTWDTEQILLWRAFERVYEPGEEALFLRDLDFLGDHAMKRLLREAEGDLDRAYFDRVKKYLARQKRLFGLTPYEGVGLLCDTQRMALEDYGAEVTDAQLWPRNLREEHDRLAAKVTLRADRSLERGFREIREKWGLLEYSDGQICAKLPRSDAELIEEGRVLKHCVGSYGADHVRGDIVIFIRHARRPERSWYTLNIDLTGRDWREVQLHGYGNDYARGKFLAIPRQVRDFVDKWEREVLEPAFRRTRERKISA